MDSAGTGAWHVGEPPDERAQRSEFSRGLDLSRQRARRIAPDDCDDFDYVLTMGEENNRTVASLCRGSAVVRPFLDFAKATTLEMGVPDPFYGGSEGFEHVLNLVEEVSEGLLENIRERHLSCRD